MCSIPIQLEKARVQTKISDTSAVMVPEFELSFAHN